ncbi:Prokaryotic ubiquitin-like protein Pup [Actinomycetales bacterium JB111]|nr:Prokaryotic ubiquitin-like protein Pup [Actinomycetales bacterium JB111]
MSEQEQFQRPRPEPEADAPGPAPTPAARAEQVSRVDDILDEIDSVLETNAQEFVQGFVQKGGQ